LRGQRCTHSAQQHHRDGAMAMNPCRHLEALTEAVINRLSALPSPNMMRAARVSLPIECIQVRYIP
jgi:hypothetical protein